MGIPGLDIVGSLLGGGKSGGSSSSSSTKIGGSQLSGRAVQGVTGPNLVKSLQQVGKVVATGQKTTTTLLTIGGIVAVAFLFMRK